MERQRAPTPASTDACVWVLTPRAATASMFFAFGVGLGAWSGASAAIVARIGLDPSTYGAALTLFTAAYLAAMSSAGAISRRFTAKRALPRCCSSTTSSAISHCRRPTAFSPAWSI